MSPALIELLFWIVVFVVFFFGFRKLQDRKRAARDRETDMNDAAPSHPRNEKDG